MGQAIEIVAIAIAVANVIVLLWWMPGAIVAARKFVRKCVSNRDNSTW